jgi:peptide chain release factor 1
LLEIRFGSGGQDSKNFVNELFGAYVYYAKKNGFFIEILDSGDGSVTARISGNEVWKYFKDETGQHCCQRVPVTERSGRKQTSLVSVAILPMCDNVWEPLKESEVEIIAQRGTQKAGGQKANKTSSAIRATHIPTGVSVFIQNERSQHQNKEIALKILCNRVNDLRQSQIDKNYSLFRQSVLGNGRRGSKIRTYNFKDLRVVDHRLGKKTTRVDEVMKGRFDLLK